MLSKLKRALHFPIAKYFLFFAGFKIRRWKPRVIVVTGSSGKTTLLHMIESQLGNGAKYSHKANSLFGVAFDILGIKRKTLRPYEWIGMLLSTPFRAFLKVPNEKIYIVEVDCYLHKAGELLGNFLKPEVLLWISSGRTHSMNFDHTVPSKFKDVREAIAYEHGNLVEHTSKLVLVNGDNELIVNELSRASAKTKLITRVSNLKEYEPGTETTRFVLKDTEVILPVLAPEEVFYSIELTRELLKYLDKNFDTRFTGLTVPPGRSSAFRGIKNTTLVDSTYNSNLVSVKAILNMFKEMPGNKKWLVMGDMLELGEKEREEHELLAEEIAKFKADKIILFGELCKKYTKPKLENLGIVSNAYTNLQELLNDINNSIRGGESILFKGSQSCQLDAVLGKLLENSEDLDKLPRQEIAWKKRREALGLSI